MPFHCFGICPGLADLSGLETQDWRLRCWRGFSLDSSILYLYDFICIYLYSFIRSKHTMTNLIVRGKLGSRRPSTNSYQRVLKESKRCGYHARVCPSANSTSSVRSGSSAMPFNSGRQQRCSASLSVALLRTTTRHPLSIAWQRKPRSQICWGRWSPKTLRRDSEIRCRFISSYRVILCHAGWKMWMISNAERFWAVRSCPSLKQLLQLCHPRMMGTWNEKYSRKILSSTSALHTGWTHRT